MRTKNGHYAVYNNYDNKKGYSIPHKFGNLAFYWYYYDKFGKPVYVDGDGELYIKDFDGTRAKDKEFSQPIHIDYYTRKRFNEQNIEIGENFKPITTTEQPPEEADQI